jgi:hypothetical protein
MAAWFKRHPRRRAGGILDAGSQGVGFGMRSAESLMEAFADDPAASSDDAADGGIGLDPAPAARRQRQRAAHHLLI